MTSPRREAIEREAAIDERRRNILTLIVALAATLLIGVASYSYERPSIRIFGWAAILGWWLYDEYRRRR